MKRGGGTADPCITQQAKILKNTGNPGKREAGIIKKHTSNNVQQGEAHPEPPGRHQRELETGHMGSRNFYCGMACRIFYCVHDSIRQ
jgi:hypothetical protein